MYKAESDGNNTEQLGKTTKVIDYYTLVSHHTSNPLTLH